MFSNERRTNGFPVCNCSEGYLGNNYSNGLSPVIIKLYVLDPTLRFSCISHELRSISNILGATSKLLTKGLNRHLKS